MLPYLQKIYLHARDHRHTCVISHCPSYLYTNVFFNRNYFINYKRMHHKQELKGWILSVIFFAVLFFFSFRYFAYQKDQELEALIQEEEIVYQEAGTIDTLIRKKEYIRAFSHLNSAITTYPYKLYKIFPQLKSELTIHLKSWAEEAITRGDTATYFHNWEALITTEVRPAEPKDKILMAKYLLHAGKYEMAAALTNDPNHYELSMASELIYLQAMEKMGKKPNLSNALQHALSNTYIIREKAKEAKENGSRLISFSPKGYWHDACLISQYYLDDHHLNKSLIFAELASEIRPDAPEPWLLIGNIFQEWKTQDSPCSYWRKASDRGSEEARQKLAQDCR